MDKVVLLSGGADSATCLALALKNTNPKNVIALNVFYGQRHAREAESARAVAEHYGVKLIEMDMSQLFAFSDCSLLQKSSQTVPHGSYAEQQKEAGENPVSTYVPYRNGLMISAAASIAVSVGAAKVYYAAHADDAAGSAYPDCSVAFAEAIGRAVKEGTGGQVELVAPFVSATKAEVIRQGLRMGVPYHLTWSCYNGGEKPCGVCGTCIDRAKAFAANGIRDPLEESSE